MTCNRVMFVQKCFHAAAAANKQGLSTANFCNSTFIICTWQHQYSAPHQADHSKTTNFAFDFIQQHDRQRSYLAAAGGGT